MTFGKKLGSEVLYPIWISKLQFYVKDIFAKIGLNIPIPVIEIVDVASYWGQWDPLGRNIKLASSLVWKHNWDMVCGILKHELAHLVVSEVYKSDDAGHGPQFLKACLLIGVEAQFRSATTNLPHDPFVWKNEGSEDPIVRKIAKLVALSESKNHEEAELALVRIRELQEKYNQEHREELNKKGFVSLIIETNSKKLSRVHSYVCSLLQEFFGIRVVSKPMFNAIECEELVVLDFMGSPEHVLMAEFIWVFLDDQLKSSWMAIKRRENLPVSKKISFQIGFLDGVQKKLWAREKSTTPQTQSKQSKALAVIQEKALDTYVAERYSRLRSRSSGSLSIHKGVYEQGLQTGLKLNLNRPLGNQNSNQKSQLRLSESR